MCINKNEVIMSNIEVRLRVESELKKNAESVFQNMGMTMSEAIRIFLKQSVNSSGLPFRPHLNSPNKITLQAFKSAEEGDFDELSEDDFSNYLQDLDNEKN